MESSPRKPTTGAEITPAECRVICREAVAIWKETVGRGATYTQAYPGPSGFSIVFRDVLTHVERSLLEEGPSEQVHEIRRQLFSANRERMIAAVERSSGRTVETVLYDIDPDHDVCAFTFVFAGLPAE